VARCQPLGTGARVADVVREQVPRIDEAGEPELVTCAAGANDIIRLGFRRVAEALRELIRALPPRAVLATIPQGLLPRRTRELNQIIRSGAPAAGLRIADAWAHTGPPWQGRYASDDFHPNDTGYGEWCAAFAEAIGLDGS
jgi:lysophospholipase L1-like esterase